MGLDVGVVSIEYLAQPGPPVHDFLLDLMLNPFCDRDDESETWGYIGSNNALYEFDRTTLRKRANTWANSQDFGPSEKANLCRWIRNLPWKDDHITLHLGN